MVKSEMDGISKTMIALDRYIHIFKTREFIVFVYIHTHLCTYMRYIVYYIYTLT